ncbi:hypothetical protein BC830DRAFT_84326 [Chytriomyces sp. MP71]|nr:hypothetical protein BC830DRAFT_84326 [Chytriomyces sp. MP71]
MSVPFLFQAQFPAAMRSDRRPTGPAPAPAPVPARNTSEQSCEPATTDANALLSSLFLTETELAELRSMAAAASSISTVATVSSVTLHPILPFSVGESAANMKGPSQASTGHPSAHGAPTGFAAHGHVKAHRIAPPVSVIPVNTASSVRAQKRSLLKVAVAHSKAAPYEQVTRITPAHIMASTSASLLLPALNNSQVAQATQATQAGIEAPFSPLPLNNWIQNTLSPVFTPSIVNTPLLSSASALSSVTSTNPLALAPTTSSPDMHMNQTLGSPAISFSLTQQNLALNLLHPAMGISTVAGSELSNSSHLKPLIPNLVPNSVAQTHLASMFEQQQSAQMTGILAATTIENPLAPPPSNGAAPLLSYTVPPSACKQNISVSTETLTRSTLKDSESTTDSMEASPPPQSASIIQREDVKLVPTTASSSGLGRMSRSRAASAHSAAKYDLVKRPKSKLVKGILDG